MTDRAMQRAHLKDAERKLHDVVWTYMAEVWNYIEDDEAAKQDLLERVNDEAEYWLRENHR